MKQLNAIRKLLKESNYFLTLIEAYRNDTLSEREKEHLWVGISDLALKLARKHYKESQWLDKNTWYKGRLDNVAEEKQSIRVEYIYLFIKQYKEDTPSSGVLFALHRRFAMLELLVEMKLIGIDFCSQYDMPKRTNLTALKDIMLGIQLVRSLRIEYDREPTHKEIIIAYAATRISQGKLVGWDDLQRFSERYFNYQGIKNSFYAHSLPAWME
jgi:hypothetical protein